MAKTISVRILLRSDTLSNWDSVNPILGKGEVAVVSDENKIKIGNGIDAFKTLSFLEADLPAVYTKAEVDAKLSDKLDTQATYVAGNLLIFQSNGQVMDSGKALSDLDAVGAAAGALNDAKTYTDTSIAGLGTLASKNAVSEGDLDAALSTKLNGKADKATTLAGYGIEDTYTKLEIEGLINGVIHIKGNVATVADLDNIVDPKTGDAYHITEDDTLRYWDGDSWEVLNMTVDLSLYATKTYVDDTATTKANDALDSAKTFATSESASALTSAKAYVDSLDVDATYLKKTDATVVASSTINGNIKINNTETQVYGLPDTVITTDDFVIINCGGANV